MDLSKNSLMKLERINIKTGLDIWNNFILNNSSHDINSCFIAHNPSLAEIFEEVFGYEIEYHLLKEEGKIIGLLPGFRIKDKYTSIPMFPAAGIFTNSANNKLNLYNTILEKLGKYEIRDTVKFSKYVYDEKILSYLELDDDVDTQWKKLSSDKRNHIRKGYKNGLSVKHGGEELLGDFYEIYAFNMRHLGSPLIEKTFFTNLIRNYKYGLARVFICNYENKPIGGSIVLSYMNLFEVSWASTLNEYNRLKPNMVMYWEMIKFAVESKIRFFSFGRSTRGSGTHEFKSRWGASELQLYFNYSSYSFDVRKLKLLSYLWSKLPLNLTNKVGPFIRKITRI